MNLYRSMERILYHLVLVVGGWLVKMLKIVEKLSGLRHHSSMWSETITNQSLKLRQMTILISKLADLGLGANYDMLGAKAPSPNKPVHRSVTKRTFAGLPEIKRTSQRKAAEQEGGEVHRPEATRRYRGLAAPLATALSTRPEVDIKILFSDSAMIPERFKDWEIKFKTRLSIELEGCWCW